MGINIANNVRILLSEDARSLYDKTCCYADILIERATPTKWASSWNAKAAPPTIARPQVSPMPRAHHRAQQAGL